MKKTMTMILLSLLSATAFAEARFITNDQIPLDSRENLALASLPAGTKIALQIQSVIAPAQDSLRLKGDFMSLGCSLQFTPSTQERLMNGIFAIEVSKVTVAKRHYSVIPYKGAKGVYIYSMDAQVRFNNNTRSDVKITCDGEPTATVNSLRAVVQNSTGEMILPPLTAF